MFVVRLESYRHNSEDRAEVIERPEGHVIVVADGVGGQYGGATAAQLAVRTIRHLLPQIPDLSDPSVWAQLLAEVDTVIEADPEAGQTTAVVAAVMQHGIVGASVGDSEAWLIAPDDYQDLTVAGRRKPYLGSSAAVPGAFACRDGGTLLVATDGLFKYASPNQICAAARDPDLHRATEALVALVRHPSGLPDDIALVMSQVTAGLETVLGDD